MSGTKVKQPTLSVKLPFDSSPIKQVKIAESNTKKIKDGQRKELGGWALGPGRKVMSVWSSGEAQIACETGMRHYNRG